jgi:hypothetical protein
MNLCVNLSDIFQLKGGREGQNYWRLTRHELPYLIELHIESVTVYISNLEIIAKMRYTTASALAIWVAVAAAFKDTSPYLLLSTSKYAPRPL